MKSLEINRCQFSLGVLFLLIGTLEYVFGRPPGSAYFLSPTQPLVQSLHGKIKPFGELGFLAPDFFHPLAFALMCMALLPQTFKYRLSICMAWLGINTAFELSQNYGQTLSNYLPQCIDSIPVFNNLPGYMINGTFDSFDLLAISAGALSAFIIGHLTKGGKNDEQTA